MLRTSAYWINRILWVTLVTSLVLVAAYVSIGRYYITYVERYQNDLIERFVSYSGLPLKADRLYGRWSYLSPVLTMEGLVLQSPDQGDEPVLLTESVSFQLDPLGSLLNGSLQVKQLTLTGVHGELIENQSGRWQLKGYPRPAGATDFDKVIDLVLSVDVVVISASSLRMTDSQGHSAMFESQEFSLLHDGDFRRLSLQATFDQAANPLFAVIEAVGDPRNAESFSAKAYLKLDSVDFTNQLSLIRSLGINVRHAQVSSEIWIDWKPRRIISIQGEARVPQVDWAVVTESTQGTDSPAVTQEKPPLTHVQLSFRAEKTVDDTWELWLPDMQAQCGGERLFVEKLHAKYHFDIVELAMPTFSLNNFVAQLNSLQVLSENAQSLLNILSPTGTLHNLHVDIGLPNKHSDSKNNNNQNPRFSLVANLDQVGISAWKGAPGLKGVDGYISATPAQGLVEFNSQQMSLNFPLVYRHWLDFEQAAGQVRWNIGKEGLTVKSGPINLDADFGSATGLLNLDLPAKGVKGERLMTLAIGLKNSMASQRKKLIPYTLNKGLLDWLDRSIAEGQVIDSGFIYRGSLVKGAKDDRTVQLYLNIDNASLDYHEQWPALHDVNAMVVIDDAMVDVNTQKAKMFSLDIESAHVQLKPLVKGGMWLNVDATAVGDGSDVLKVIIQSAIHKNVGTVFDQWRLQGQTQTSIKLGIPLVGGDGEHDINVDVMLLDNQLQIPEHRLNFEQINGPLHFSSKRGLVSSGLSAQFYGKPLHIGIASEDQKSTSIDIQGRIDMADVASWSQQPAMTFVSGEMDFSAKIQVEAKAQGYFSIQSDLVGVNIDLPEPFNKTNTKEQPFNLSFPLNRDETMLRIAFKDSAQLQLQLKKNALSSALLTIETDTAAGTQINTVEHEVGFFTITGNGPKIQLNEWSQVVDRYLQAAQKLKTHSSSTTNISIQVKDLSLAGVNAFNRDFDQTLITAQRRKQTWWLAISNSMLSGEIIIPDDKKNAYAIDLQRLYFPESTGEDNKGLSSVKPESLPNVDVNIADLAIGSEHYGSIAFDLRTDNQSAWLEDINGNIRGAHIRKKRPGTLSWRTVDGVTHSHLTVRLDVGDLGKTLENWHYEKIIESKTGIIDVDFHWEGNPDQWQLKISEGLVNVKIKKGRFLAASDTTTGTLKVVGIVNLANIARRLKLDFTDLYKKGISFDKISGRVKLTKGELIIEDDLDVKSPSSAFQLRGKADLEKELLDMEMTVTLPISNNLPWVAALVGGLPTAAGVYVASKLFEDQFNQLSSAIYTIDGDWNDPQMKFKRVFGHKKKTKSKTNRKKKEKVLPPNANASGFNTEQAVEQAQ
ncbi:MAG: TIGR02099 family protein [Spongiibacteraceae bacterium]|nr:TIGR02099 family protein [Spongiibacteraceae bacterium]